MSQNEENEHQPDLTPTLKTAAEVRADLHLALIETEDAISAAAPGRFQEWTDAVLGALVHLHTAFHEHISQAEGDDGLYEEIMGREPRLRGDITVLKNEHPQILEAIHAPYNRLKDRAPEAHSPAAEIREEVTHALARITRHRQKGADLVWEAYFVDLGGMD